VILHSPLVIDLDISWGLDQVMRANETYRRKCELVDKAMAERDWGKYVDLHERPYRIDALTDLLGCGLRDDPGAMYEVVALTWMDSENIRQHIRDWQRIWRSLPEPNRVMTEEERAEFEKLPDIVTVYRGIEDPRHSKWGMSYSLDPAQAEWFAKRGLRGNKPVRLTGKIVRKDVLALLTRRGTEKEIVAFGHKITHRREKKL
jgi:hypothetical protein